MKSHTIKIVKLNENFKYEKIGTAEASENIEGIFKSGVGMYTLSFPSNVPSEFKSTEPTDTELTCKAWVNFDGTKIQNN